MKFDAEALLRRYFASVKARDIDMLMQLYSPHGRLQLASGQQIVGRAALRGFFEKLFAHSPPSPEPVRILGSGLSWVAQLEIGLHSGATQRVLDLFTLTEAGEIAELAIYMAEPLQP
jgi:hypothetical protein